MKRFAAVALMLLALPAAALCQTKADCGGTVSMTLHSGGSLAIDSVSLGMEIVPGNMQDTVRVSCTSSRSDARLQLSGDAAHARLRVSGDTGHNGNLQLRIEVPKRTNLRVRMAAGQITITGVEGDKDCALTAGQITIADGRNRDYRSVDASVDIGQVNAQAYGVDKGGFFRHFTSADAKGEYRLYAHVMTGQIDLVGSKAKSEATKSGSGSSGSGSTD